MNYFNYSYLRKSFQTVLLNKLEKRIGSSFKKTKAAIYQKDKDGFYVYAKPNLRDPKSIIKYVSRYLGRPVIALSRIDSYDGESVTFHYNKHEDNSFVQRTLPAIDFIKLLIQHIPEKNFKMTRYYGLYARHGCRYKTLVFDPRKCLRHFSSPAPSILRGIRGFLFVTFSLIIVL